MRRVRLVSHDFSIALAQSTGPTLALARRLSDSTHAAVTRVVYVHEIADARRRHMRRSRMTAELRVVLDSPDGS
jgi:hypothetical protein